MTQGSPAEALAGAAAAAGKGPSGGKRLEPINSESLGKKTFGKRTPGPLDWTGRPFGGFVLDVKRRAPLYVSDWTDAFRPSNLGRTVATVLFLFFACISPAITFGNLYEKATGGSLGVVETILATGMSGVLYSILSGQPITILGATGPIFAYTVVCYDLSDMMDVEFLPFYFWTLMWCALFTVLMVATDLCALMRHVTKFSEDIFAGLISVIFIVEAIRPIVMGFVEGEKKKEAAFLELVLMVVTFRLAQELASIRRAPWLTASIRVALANFGVFLAIVVASALAALWHDVKIDMLNVSGSFEPTLLLSDGKPRSWLVKPLGEEGDFPAWAIFFSAVPAVGFAVLGYLDQNLTAILVNRPGNKLKKPAAYHLDFLVRGAVCTPLCAALGLPMAVASTVPALTHLMSLTTYTIEKLPEGRGERKVPVEVCEQRATNLLIHVLLAASLLFAQALGHVPKSVLFGVFLYMGIASLNGNALFERLLLFCIWDPKAYPQFAYVVNVKTSRMHAYTLLQAVCLAILYGLKEVKATAVVFPFFMASLMIIRKSFKYIFTADELRWLDGNEEEETEEVLEREFDRQTSPWQNPLPDVELSFSRGVTPVSKHEGLGFQREVTPMQREVTPASAKGDIGSVTPMQREVTPASAKGDV